ncbi:ZIP family metal transporter [Halanaerobium congolense]|jgi:ZIP family zinc transporter|uniref:ZIP family zinc transporter n=1 Tax=Halanaerobium congolense TaxID=54121 RepID=A0A1G6JKH1_9FIRM|nr:ZIP family metal transporter [Halanaerobium congolense]KXS49370.1 MAG: zinc transporter, ZIP family [Halanaerobium sp. T82-1]OEG63458.1 MAG: dihydroorotate dehydrogenase [Halanaerobium sp. MDAL1]PUU93444.1 MAG: zinc transporter, ZIP family [Halanaerobium sp.]PTX16211.1 ZIP family zinc transporter [Halanaerobium congolense]PXV65573.1 ZIP family zinc transporter [Halanaerobium congolense]
MILDFLNTVSPITQALLATLFTWFVTALGAGVVFFFTEVDRRLLDGMLGFAAGVMIAASFWSLLAPAIEISENLGVAGWIPAVIGFLMGGIFLRLVDIVLPHLHPALANSEPEGIKTKWQRSILLVLAVTLHNFPEGLAVGVAFGAAAVNIPSASVAGAVALALGIGLQNFPEGAAVSIPLKREGLSSKKSFLYGQSSGIVEPIAGVIGAAGVYYMRPILPYALAFAAGAMIFVVGEELIPEANSEGNSHLATTGLMLGFAVMMFLDVSLG